MIKNIMASVLGFPMDTMKQATSQEISGKISERYQKRAEQRADYRNRQMLLDQPGLTAEGRRRAGLNPYGDVSIPGMVTQSTPETPMRSMATSFDEMLAVERFNLEMALGQSQIEKNEADTQYTLESIVGISLSNEIKEIEKEVASFNFNLDKQKAPLLLEQMRSSIDKLNAEKEKLLASAEVDEKQLAVMDASIDKMNKELSLLDAQIALAESGVELNEATIQNMRERLVFDKDVEERVKTQGLAGLRLDAASLGLQSERFDWEKMAKEIDQELRSEGLDIDWSRLGTSALSAIVWFLSIYFSGGATATAGGAVKGISSIVRRASKFVK